MRIQQEVNSNIEYIGEIRENKVGIDRENIDFIATLLTSNLYSKPFESFLREAISNAHDSHVEADTDHPIILMIKQNIHADRYNWIYNPTYTFDISIRDYGIGISPERFQQIYTNIGSSTKRESNEYIGGWGIGRFAALACSDNVQINSYYDGVKYSYMMYKNGTGINIDKISETKGDYKQGVEIFVNNINLDVDTIKESISKLIFFDNLTIHAENIEASRLNKYISEFNKRKIIKFKNFATTDYKYINNGTYVKIGNVLYEMNNSKLNNKVTEGYNFIAVECPIGAVNVTPNREELQYTDKTNNKIRELFSNVSDEINKLILDKINRDFPNINQAYTFYIESNSIEIAPRIRFNAMTMAALTDLKVRGQKIPEDVSKILQQMRYEYIYENAIHVFLNKDSNRRRMSKKDTKIEELFRYNIALKCDDKLRCTTKEYYLSKHSEPTIVVKPNELQISLKELIRKLINRQVFDNRIQILRAVSFILKNFDYYKLENDKVPKSFIEENKKSSSKSNKQRVDIRRYKYDKYWIYGLKEYISYYVNEKTYGKNQKIIHRVVYAPNTKDDSLIRDLAKTFESLKIEFITLKKEDIPNIPNNKTFISLENFLTLYQKIISKAATALYLRKNYENAYHKMGDSVCGHNCEHKTEFYSYLDKYLIYSSNNDIDKLLKQYEEKKWLDWAAIIKFSLTDEDIKRLNQRSTIAQLTEVTDSLLYVIKGKYKNDDKFGIKPDRKTTLLLKKLLKL